MGLTYARILNWAKILIIKIEIGYVLHKAYWNKGYGTELASY
ncbi:MAG: hypothetical protein K0S11_1814 [Gammaproteobacteria bacterium]|jgi:RimJ/RimL family protein N-acetyltransferase|nr:hypothetical protein [Gammaproteobacteria bacterium]